jgi:outer membrane protein OmpA-like peptidoglycan-associated protein
VFGELTPSGLQRRPAGGAMPAAVALSQIEGLAGFTLKPDRMFSIGLAVGRGISDAVGTPALRGVFSLSVVPGGAAIAPIHAERPDGDADGDGIPDSIDKCPNEPEDFDGFEDADGCPDPDNDKDGIPDIVDKCPNVPGVAPDGCPKKYNLVVVTEKKIELKQTVFFDTNRARIKSVSFALLNDVAQAMKDNSTLKVEIQGHTDSQGNEKFNLKLSQKRAESVRTYLIKKGVASDRMVPKGYGKEVPIADNRTADGRSQNRRVEFVINSR